MREGERERDESMRDRDRERERDVIVRVMKVWRNTSGLTGSI
jgi:hypothetical protein